MAHDAAAVGTAVCSRNADMQPNPQSAVESVTCSWKRNHVRLPSKEGRTKAHEQTVCKAIVLSGMGTRASTYTARSGPSQHAHVEASRVRNDWRSVGVASHRSPGWVGDSLLLGVTVAIEARQRLRGRTLRRFTLARVTRGVLPRRTVVLLAGSALLCRSCHGESQCDAA